LFVANIKSFTGRVLHRIVRPRRETKLMRIFEPGVGAAAFSNHSPKGGICDDIGPWRWSYLSRTKCNDVLVTVGSEAAQPVVKNRFAQRRFSGHLSGRLAGPRERRSR